MSAEEKKEEEKILGKNVSDPVVNEANISEIGGNIQDQEMAYSNADNGTQSSIAPSLDGVVNSEGISMIEVNNKKEEKSNDTEKKSKFLFPKLFVSKEDLIEVDIEIVFDPDSGDIYSITQPGLINTSVLSSLHSVRYVFKFRPVSYDDMQKYRRQSSFYDSEAKDLVINRLTLRSLFMINHLRETDMVDSYGKPFEMKFDEETDNLSLGTVNKLYETVPALLDVVMTLFERKLLILFQVNQ